MSDQRKLVFRTDVTSALFGMFNAGDIATGIDPKIADDLVASGCAVWADGDGKAQAEQAAAAAGKITTASQALPVQRQEHSFSVGNLGEQQAAGVVSPAGTVAGAMVPPGAMAPMQSRGGPVTMGGTAGTAHAGPDASATGPGHAPGQSSDAAAGTAPK